MTRNSLAKVAYNIGLYCWIVAIVVAYCCGLRWPSAILAVAGCAALVFRLAWDPEFRMRSAPMPIDYILIMIWLIELGGLTRSVYYRNTLQSFIDLSTLISVYYIVRLSISSRLHHVGIWLVGTTAGLLLSVVTIGQTIYFHVILTSYSLGNTSNLRAVFSVPVSGGSASEKLSVLLALLPFPILVAVEFWRKNRGVSILGAVSAFTLAVSSLLTLSRGMYLAVGVFTAVLMTLLLRYSSMSWRRIAVTATLLTVSVCLAILPWQRAVVTTALMGRTSVQVRSAEGRADLWRMYATVSKARPAFGVGRGNLGLIPVHLDDRNPAEGFVYASAFNTAITLLVESGAVGLGCYLMLLAWFLISALRYLRDGMEELDLLEMSLCLAAIVSVCLRDMTACSILTQPMTALLLCILAAMASRRPVRSAREPICAIDRLSMAKAPGVVSSCLAVLFFTTMCVLAWQAFRFERAETRYADCASAVMQGHHELAKAAIEDAVNLDSRNALYIAARGLVNANALDAVPFSWPIAELPRRLSLDVLRSLRSSAADYESVIRLNSADALAWHNLGWLYYFLGKREQALAAVQRSASLDETDWTAQVSLGLQLEAGGCMTEALAAFQRALMLNPQLVETRFFAELRQRHPNSASEILSGALAMLERGITATHSPILAAKAGKLALVKGELELAAANLEFATRQMPLLYRAWVNLASVYTLRGKEDEAKRCHSIAELINPVDTETRERRGEYRSSSDSSKSGQRGLDDSHPRKVQHFGQFSDRNVRLSREYLLDPMINNNVVPGSLLSYAQ